METDAAQTSRQERHIAPGEIQFLTTMLLKYGNNYKVKKYIAKLLPACLPVCLTLVN
jgi:hypothetical protein